MMRKWALLLWKRITSESFLQGLLIFLLIVLAGDFSCWSYGLRLARKAMFLKSYFGLDSEKRNA